MALVVGVCAPYLGYLLPTTPTTQQELQPPVVDWSQAYQITPAQFEREHIRHTKIMERQRPDTPPTDNKTTRLWRWRNWRHNHNC
jgi:hypothetical protein